MTNKQRSVPTIRSTPDLVRKEALAALVTLAVVCLVSALWDAPIEAPADPQGIPAAHVKAPWIFVGIQQMLRWCPPWLAGVAAPLAALVVLAVIPLLPRSGKMSALVTCVFFLLTALACLLTVWGYLV
ncbi:MAG: hypothetical protein LDL33_06980 [Desulfomonile sp.]|nr:hypothetical protein [Desulfomonile sp.]